MNEKEVAELRRQLRPDRHTISQVFGCYVNEQKEIISTFEQPMGLLTEEESEQYLTLLKKSLSGGLGRNLVDIEFSTRQVAEGEEHALLMKLRETKLKEPEARNTFYDKVIQSVNLDSNYLILIAYSAYDVPFRSKNDEVQPDGSENVFTYLLCSICPVKKSKPGLGYDHNQQTFHIEKGDWLVSAPQMGFLFPAFDDRSTNLYNALYYTKNIEDSQEELIDALFHVKPPKPAAEQKRTFEAILTDSLGEECSMEVVQTVHDQLSGLIEAHKESKVPEPLMINRNVVEEVLETCGVSEEHLAKFNVQFDSEFGTNQPVSPKNIIDNKRFEVKTPDVVIKVSPECRDLVETRVIDGVKYIMIRAEDSVEVNGVNIQFGEDAGYLRE
jgi:hypothetical protein